MRGMFEGSIGDRESIAAQLVDHDYVPNSEIEQAKKSRNDELLGFLEESGTGLDTEKIENYKNTPDPLARLPLLLKMNTREVIKAFDQTKRETSNDHYLQARLDFYQRLINGQGFRKHKETRDGEEIEVVELINKQDVTTEGVRAGMYRDFLFAEMLGTPEMGIYKMALDKCRRDGRDTRHMIKLSGTDSGIVKAVKLENEPEDGLVEQAGGGRFAK